MMPFVTAVPGSLRSSVFGGALPVAVLAAAGGGLLVAASGAHPAVLALAAGVSLILVIAAMPIIAAYAWLLVGPLIVGMPRGDGIMVLRPNEGLLLIAAAGIGLRVVWRLARGERVLPTIGPIDLGVALLVVTGSIMPLLLRYGRGLPLSQDDILYAMVFIKYFILYALFRLSVATAADVDRCLKLALVGGAMVAVVALLQVGGVSAVLDILDRYYDSPFEGTDGADILRGSSTLASSFGLADMMAMCLAITLAWLGLQRGRRILLLPGGVLFLGGCVAAGSFSGVIGLAVVVVAVGVLTRRLMAQLAVMVPAAVIAMLAFWPVVAARLGGFEGYRGMPRSWLGRLENLERFFWPEVFSGFNWLVGVRPAARVPAPELWRQWVYIESGHTWLLWTGGVPLLLAFFFFSWVAVRDLYRIAVAGNGPVSVAAAAGFASTLLIFILMLFDAHLTVRGSADLFFPLLALSLVAGTRRTSRETGTGEVGRSRNLPETTA
jgi:hypothetical protein